MSLQEVHWFYLIDRSLYGDIEYNCNRKEITLYGNIMDNEKIDSFAKKLWRLASDTIIINMRFMDAALLKLPVRGRRGQRTVACNGKQIFYEPLYVIEKYSKDSHSVARIYLHIILHFIFNHSFNSGKLNADLWDLSCDIAVENMIMEMEVPAMALSDDDERRLKLKGLKKGVDFMSAERIYKYFLANPPSSIAEFKRLFFQDDHVYWREVEKLEISEQEWKKINERIKAELRSFSKGRSGVESLIKNLEEAVKDRQDYGALLERFCARGEEMKVSEDEFDYIYYTYGLEHYDNMPLIEPLEFRDTKKIRDFVIVLDTSASCRGDIIRSFLAKTYNIIHNSESFFQKVNVHILQCDNEVQSDTKIQKQSDFDDFIKNGSFVGFGGTDFRPAFDYIDGMVENEEFTDLKGVIYFTDGYGIYPEKAPEYECIFAFLNEDEHRGQTPWWVIPVVLDEEQLS